MDSVHRLSHRLCRIGGATSVLLAVLLALTPPANAQFTDYTWTGVFSGDWNYSNLGATNWVGVRPASASTTRLIFGGAVTKAMTNDRANPFLLNRLTFNDAGYSLNGGALDFRSQSGVTPQLVHTVAGTNTINTNITTQTLEVGVSNALGILFLTGQLTGSGDLIKTGSGDLRLTHGSNSITGDLFVEGGSLSLLSGGKMSNRQGLVGNSSGGVGTVTVSGAGSQWTNSDDLYVGDAGQGTLSITNGGLVSNDVGLVGFNSGSVGSITVSGAGSQWTNTSDLYFGYSGQGTLNITNGGQVSNGIGVVGVVSRGVGSITVSGAGSQWTNTGNLFVGNLGQGTLSIESGGKVSNTFGLVGTASESVGSITVSGAGSQWTNTGNLFVGNSGQGTLSITNGGLVSNFSGRIGSNSGGVGTVTVSGAGSQWTNTSDLYVGYSGQGTLSILDGGKVSNTFGYVGTASGGVGTVTVSGVGSQWTNTGNLYVGDAGQGTLSITNGGLVSNTIGVIGNNSDGVGTVTVSGVGSQWKNSGDLYIGISGQGTLNITNGGQVSNLVGFVGYSTGGVGTMTVSGAGSQWTNDTEMYVGTSGQGTLNITNGGQVSNRSGHVGYLSGSVGTVTVSGSGSQWTNRGILFVGDAGQGTLNITNGGVVTVGGVTILNNGANSILNMNNGTLVTNTLAGSFGSTLSLTGINTLTIASNSTFIGNIIGTGGLNKTGNILLTLTGNNTHTGNSTVQAGTLRFNGGTNNAPFTVQNGAILRVGGGVTLNGNGQKLTALTGGQVIYEGAVNGSIALLGGGTHTINQAGLTFEAGNTTATSQVVQNASTTLNNSIIRGIWQSNADLAANGAVFTSTATVNVNSTATFTDVESAGTLNIPNGVTVTVGGSSPLVLAGGKTYVGSVANPGGTIDGAVDLNGGLLVNNGTITGMTTINFGAIAKGTGNYAGGYTITDRGQIIFGNSPGTLRSGSAVWEAGAQLIFQIDQATGVAGVNWGFNDITGSLTLASSSANAYTLLLESLVLGSGETLGQLSGFDHRRNYEWLWIRTLSSVSNFDADAFRFDVAGFAANNPLNGGMFSVVERDNSLWVQFTSSSSQSAAPEPTTFVLLGVGFIGVAGCRKRGI